MDPSCLSMVFLGVLDLKTGRAGRVRQTPFIPCTKQYLEGKRSVGTYLPHLLQ